MDETAPGLHFDENGVCDLCHVYDRKVEQFVLSGNKGMKRMSHIINTIARNGGRYDCLIGLSGGVDSSFLAWNLVEMGLKPLAVHFDNGWNSETSVANIKKILDVCGIDLHTLVVDWDEFRDLQLAFLKAGVPDLEIPTDHAIVALQLNYAVKMGIPYIISGANVRTESHVPAAWSQGHWDWRYIKDIHRHYGTRRLKTFPRLSLSKMMRVKWIRMLNYMDYNKFEAKQFLINELGWEDYGWKHFESIYTRFYQGHILPVRFGYDKRKSHLSSLICSGIITRKEALAQLAVRTYSTKEMVSDRTYVIKKLDLSEQAWEHLMDLPHKTYHDFANNEWILKSDLFQRIYQRCTSI
jgi:N-acetyl sugar amidotransferase